MTENLSKRKLAAIIVADVVGYSRLMRHDETGTLARLTMLRQEVIEPRVSTYGGRIVKLMGDGILFEFPSVVDALACAVETQRALAEAGKKTAENQRIQFRVGINVGDVIVQDDDIYGDGVNIAARLEGIAEPGGICISQAVFAAVSGKLSLQFDDMGEQQVKNIAEPVRAYRVKQNEPGVSSLSVEAPDQATPKLADKLSIAVLPFTNLSGDSEQEYFSDGITEDIITELSRFKNLVVTSRNSSFAFKASSVDTRKIKETLGVRYVVEGSVRRAGNRVRITGQLIDALSSSHLWAERYDRNLDDIFAVQDEVVRAIAGAIPGHLNRVLVQHIRRKTPSNLSAYDCELRGRWALAHWNEGLETAIEWFEKSVEADPEYALAHAALATAYVYGLYALGLPPDTVLARGKEHARRAISLDDRDPSVNAYAAFTYHVSGEHALARKHAARAVELNPNDPFVLYVQACALSYTGDPEEALEWFAKSEQLEPYAPDDQRLDTLCDCYYMLGDYHKVEEIHNVYQNVPAFLYIIAAAAFAQAGEMEKAKRARSRYERLRPAGHDVKTMFKYQMQMCSRQEDRDHWFEGYRKAGFEV